MIKLVNRLLALLFLLAALPIPPVQAEGGMAVRPYWTFKTDAPVTHIQAGDIDSDGVPEVVMVTANNWVYVVENDGDLAWRYELETVANALLVDDLDGNDQTAEIFIAGKTQEVLLSNTKKPVWANNFEEPAAALAVFAADLNGDGWRDLIEGTNDGFGGVLDGQGGTPLFEFYYLGPPAIDIWAGEMDGDGLPEIVPNPASGNEIYVLENTLRLAWRQLIEDEVGLVQGGDVDGDGQAEVAVLSTSWALLLLESDGRQVWRQPALVTGQALARPTPGQLLLQDLDGDGRVEIIVLAGATIYSLDQQGRKLWQQHLGQFQASQANFGLSNDKTGRLLTGDINGDGQAELLAALPELRAVYLLAADGRRLAEYHPSTGSGEITGALDYADLNDDGWGEVIIGTETGVQVFGASIQVEFRELWQSPFMGSVTALHVADLDGDSQGEIVAGSQEGWVYLLANDGYVLAQIDLEGASIFALGAGDVDGDGQQEIVAGTLGGGAALGGNQVHLLDGTRPIWTVQVRGSFIHSLAVHDLDDDSQAEIIIGTDLLSGSSLVTLLDSQGELIWEREFAERVSAVGGDGGQVLVGTESGQIYWLTAAGAPAREIEFGARVLSFAAGSVATADGRVYRLDEGQATLVGELGTAPRIVQMNAGATAMLAGEREVRLVIGNETRWQGMLDSRALQIAAGDLNDDGETEIGVGSDEGRVHLFGQSVNQPPLLTKPHMAETRAGYAYSVDVNDPDFDTVTVTVEIWDPSASVWLTGTGQAFTQGQGRLNLAVPDPFDTWDSGRESRFRFKYDDGHTQSTLSEIAGPFAIPTLPWYVYYGRWAGLGGLILLFPVFGFLFYRRQQAYRRSPVGRAESLLKQLRAHPEAARLRLHTVARDQPVLLAYLPGLAREAGEDAIADLSEGFQLIVTRPEVVVEGLRTVVRQGREDTGDEEAKETTARLALQTESESHELENKRRTSLSLSYLTNLYELCLEALEANTVARIVGLQASLTGPKDSSLVTNSVTLPATTEVVTIIKSAMAELGQAAQALYNYQRVETVEDKVAYLAQAIETLGRLDREFQATLPQPERNIFSRIAFNWLAVAANALEDLQGRAQIEVSLKTRQVLTLEQAALSLELRNTGRSPASNLTISLSPDQTFAVGNGTAQLDILPAGRSALVEIPFSTAPSVDQFRAEFAITYDDRERSGKTVAFADLVRLLKPATEFQPVPNPYAPGTPLRPGAPTFFGRHDLFQFIAENMGSLARQNILVLIGQRRMGKTSFLQQLPARLSQDYLPVFLDGQSLGIDPGMANFFYDLSLAIADALADQGLEIRPPKPEEFHERPSAAFERTFLPAVFEAIGQRRLLLLFDEFEELEMRVASGKLEPTIFPFFRHLMQHGDKLGFIFVGTHRLEELTADYWSILFNIALYKQVTFLSEAAARALIVEPVARYGLLYDDLALDKILRVSAGHPYFLQLICHALVNRANRARQGYLTIQDVNDALGELVELGEAHFAFLWEQSSPLEQLTLAALMRLLNKMSTVTASQIVELLTERGMTPDVREVREALRRLVERDIVHELAGEPPRYEYKVDLVRLWVEQYKPLGRVVEDMEL